jgi:putative membrane protein
MSLIADLLVLLVALLHVFFLVLEMFLWTRPTGLRVFALSPDFAKASRVLAANQGLYNGFLAAGLVWALILGPAGAGLRVFFLVCVVVAGVFGGLTVNKRILAVQALPALAALLLIVLGG